MPVTIKDIAKEVGVSHVTVSRVLNGKRDVPIADATFQRVQEAAERLGYRKNYHARSLKSGRANAIGVLYYGPFMGRSWSNFWGRVLYGVSAAAARHGQDFVVITSEEMHDQRLIERGLSGLSERRVDGLVVPGIMDLVPHAAALRATGAPVVVAMWHDERRLDLPVVQLDEEPGLEAAAAHLAELGHRRVAWIDLPRSHGERGRRFHAHARRHGLACVDVRLEIEPAAWRAMPSAEQGRAASEQLARWLAEAPPQTAAMCYNEHLAHALYGAAAARGLAIPRDLSIVGFDDLYAEFAIPPMTVVSHAHHRIGEAAGELLHAMIEGKKRMSVLCGRTIPVPTALVVRESTASPRPR
jgi:LacI family transcriptional regulator